MEDVNKEILVPLTETTRTKLLFTMKTTSTILGFTIAGVVAAGPLIPSPAVVQRELELKVRGTYGNQRREVSVRLVVRECNRVQLADVANPAKKARFDYE